METEVTLNLLPRHLNIDWAPVVHDNLPHTISIVVFLSSNVLGPSQQQISGVRKQRVVAALDEAESSISMIVMD